MERITSTQKFPNPLSSFSDRKSTRLNSSHLGISYAVFCFKKIGLRFVLPGDWLFRLLGTHPRQPQEQSPGPRRSVVLVAVFSMIKPPPRSTLFPSATLFRS